MISVGDNAMTSLPTCSAFIHSAAPSTTHTPASTLCLSLCVHLWRPREWPVTNCASVTDLGPWLLCVEIHGHLCTKVMLPWAVPPLTACGWNTQADPFLEYKTYFVSQLWLKDSQWFGWNFLRLQGRSDQVASTHLSLSPSLGLDLRALPGLSSLLAIFFSTGISLMKSTHLIPFWCLLRGPGLTSSPSIYHMDNSASLAKFFLRLPYSDLASLRGGS